MSNPRTTLINPRFFLEANGALASDLVPYISKFEYEDDEAKQDVFRITVENPRLKFDSDPRLAQGVKYRVRFGYAGNMSDVKNVVIAKARPKYDSQPSITMVAYGLTKEMNLKASPQNWGPVSSSAVATEIAKRYKFDTDIEDSGDARSQSRTQPAGITDFQFLMQLAKVLNWDFYIEGTTLHFHHKRYESPASLTFTYLTDARGTLISFDPDVSLNAPPSTGVVGASTKDAKTTAASGVTGAAKKLSVLLDTNVGRGLGLVNALGYPKAADGESGLRNASPEDAKKVLQAHGAAAKTKIDMSAIKAQAVMIGDPRIRARTMIRIEGVAPLYTGNWRVSSSKHSLDGSGSYQVQVGLKRDAGKAASKDQNKKDANGKNGADGTGAKPFVVVDANLGASYSKVIRLTKR